MIIGREVEKLSVEELVGELFMPRLEVQSFQEDKDYRLHMERLVREHKVGGFCIFGGTIETVCRTIAHLQRLAIASSQVPLLFSADFEFGLPMRLNEGGTEFPDAMALGKTGDIMLTMSVAKAIARESQLLGIGWNFAPVADVNSNPRNPIINTRSFGEEPKFVSAYVEAFVRGLEEEGIAASAKHFPGHGDTYQDSHSVLPVLSIDLERFDRLEGVPFRGAIEADVHSIMTGHLAAPQIAKELGKENEGSAPATLSRSLTTTLLRERLGFDGVIVTDALEMHAVTNTYSSGEAAIMAFEAGADVLLLSPDTTAAYDALLKRVKEEPALLEQLKRSVARIFALKVFVQVPLDPDPATFQKAIDAFGHRDLSKEAASRAIEISNKPAKPIGGARYVILVDERELTIKKANHFAKQLLQLEIAETAEVITAKAADDQFLLSSDRTVLVTFHRARGYIGDTGDVKLLPNVVQGLCERSSSLQLAGAILVGSPYLDVQLGKSLQGFCIKTYSESWVSCEAVIDLLKKWSE